MNTLTKIYVSLLLPATVLLLGMSESNAACSNPSGNEGDVAYNSTYHVMQFCNDTNWVSMGGVCSMAETDPKIGTLTSGDFCTTNGSTVNCTTAAIDLSSQVTGNLGVSHFASGTSASSSTFWRGDGTWASPTGLDARIGTLTASRWCQANAGGTAFDCTQTASPSTPECPLSEGIATVDIDCCNDVMGIWGDGTYLYASVPYDGVYAYTFNGTSWTRKAKYTDTRTLNGIWGDGTYVYVAEGSPNGVRALSFDGTTFTNKTAYTTSGEARAVWGTGSHIYVSAYNGLYDLSFNGTSWTLNHSWTPSVPNYIDDVFGQGGYVFAIDSGTVKAFDANLTHLATYTMSYWGDSVHGDGTYIYATDETNCCSNLYALTFNGSAFTKVGEYDATNGDGFSSFARYANGYVYFGVQARTRVLTFDGSSFTLKAFMAPASWFGYATASYPYASSGVEQIAAYPACSP